MRICLVAHGFPPLECTGVESHCAALAAALARAGHTVEVFVPRGAPEPPLEVPERSQRREVREGYGITWITLTRPPRAAADHLERPGAAHAFEEFLERERPEVVHFQHLAKLGVGLIEVARRRGLPVLYTAHDYYPVCHRMTLIRPDLSVCSTLGDPAACARCDAAAALLDGLGRLGDYQMGALRDQLGPGEAVQLSDALTDDAPPDVLAERCHLDQRREEAFTLVDRVLAPTRFLAERLAAGGFDAERLVVMPCGIETAELAALEPPRLVKGGRRELLFGYIGGISKHKGLHHLLEAFAGLRAPARLAVFGDGSDQTYVDRVRAEAGAAGAAWYGRFDARALPDVMAKIDVVVVPSAWNENAPFVIREAHAARRPVIASRIGALPESVRDGVNGLLFEPGDPAALTAAMERLALEPDLLARLVEGCPPPRSIDTHAAELVSVYEQLRVGREQRTPMVPAHLAPFVERARALEAMPQRELFARVVRGLDELGRGLGLPGQDGGARLVAALEAGGGVAERARDKRREGEWLRESLKTERAAVGEAKRALGDESAASRALEEERDWLRGTLAGVESERDWLKTVAAAAETERDWRVTSERARAQEADWLQAVRVQLQAERDWLRSAVEGLEREREWLRAERDAATSERAAAVDDRAEVAGELDRVRTHAAALAEHERWLRGELVDLIGDVSGDAESPGPEALPEALETARERLARVRREMAWRRSEMERARSEGGALFRRMVASSGLGRRMRAWGAEGPE